MTECFELIDRELLKGPVGHGRAIHDLRSTHGRRLRGRRKGQAVKCSPNPEPRLHPLLCLQHKELLDAAGRRCRTGCRPPTDRGCKGPFKEPPLTAELGGPARAALLVMRERTAEPEVRIHSPPAESQANFQSVSGGAPAREMGPPLRNLIAGDGSSVFTSAGGDLFHRSERPHRIW